MLTDCTVNRPFPFVSLRERRYEYKRNVIVHSRIVVVFVIPGPFGGIKYWIGFLKKKINLLEIVDK
jgi:hypothetical protein